MEPLYTVAFRKSANLWVALCLENGLVGQGNTKEEAMRKLKEAIVSFEEARETEDDVYTAPIAVGELHEFLACEEDEPAAQSYELRAMYA